MEDITSQNQRLEALKKYHENPGEWIKKFAPSNTEFHRHYMSILVAEKEKGYLVKTKYGTGRTKHSDQPIQGKLPVYLDNGQKVMCDPKNIKLTGFID